MTAWIKNRPELVLMPPLLWQPLISLFELSGQSTAPACLFSHNICADDYSLHIACVCVPLYKEGFQGCKQVHKRLNHLLFQAPGLKRLEQTARCDKLSKVRKANSVEVMAQEISFCLPIEKMSPDKMSPDFLRVLRVFLSSACLTSSSLPPSGVTFFFRVFTMLN